MVKKMDEILAKLVLKTAINVEKAPSIWGCYQPKEPKELIGKLKNDGERIKKKLVQESIPKIVKPLN